MKILVNGKVIGEIVTNRSMTIEEAMYIHGYDLNNIEDLKRGYEDDVEGFYVDDFGNYAFDIEAAEMVY